MTYPMNWIKDQEAVERHRKIAKTSTTAFVAADPDYSPHEKIYDVDPDYDPTFGSRSPYYQYSKEDEAMYEGISDDCDPTIMSCAPSQTPMLDGLLAGTKTILSNVVDSAKGIIAPYTEKTKTKARTRKKPPIATTTGGETAKADIGSTLGLGPYWWIMPAGIVAYLLWEKKTKKGTKGHRRR